MSVLKLVSLSALAVASFGATSAMARPVHHKPRQICKIEHVHGHAKRVCHWVR